MPVVLEGLVVEREFDLQFLVGHVDQSGQYVAAEPAGRLEGVRALGAGEPDRQLGLDGLGVQFQFDVVPEGVLGRDRGAFPEFADGVHGVEGALSPVLPAVRVDGEVHRAEPGGQGDVEARPWDRLSTTAHSSATRMGLCRGSTTLPARMPRRWVAPASAAPSTEGLG